MKSLRSMSIVGLVLLLQLGCGTKKDAASDTHLHYTVRNENGTRSSRNRESVLKTVGMTQDQIQTWAKEGAADEGRSVATENDLGGTGAAVITCRNERGRVSSRDASVTNVLRMTDDQIREWVAEDKGIKEGRSATLYMNGHVEIIWRGSSDQLLYTVRNEKGSRTSRDRAERLENTGDERRPDQSMGRGRRRDIGGPLRDLLSGRVRRRDIARDSGGPAVGGLSRNSRYSATKENVMASFDKSYVDGSYASLDAFAKTGAFSWFALSSD